MAVNVAVDLFFLWKSISLVKFMLLKPSPYVKQKVSLTYFLTLLNLSPVLLFFPVLITLIFKVFFFLIFLNNL